MKVSGYDFSGWATKNDLKCADGRVIRRDAFKINDGTRVPLIWNHKHDSTSAVLGHALLENRDEGVYTYGFLNNTKAGKDAKEMLQHGDIVSLSIFANNLVQDGPNVLHGAIREVSLVLAGANPGAFIESTISHGYSIDESEEEGLIYTGESIELSHSDVELNTNDDSEDNNEEDDNMHEDEEDLELAIGGPVTEDDEDYIEHSDDGEENKKTIEEIINTMTDEQKDAMYAIVGAAVEEAEGNSKEDNEMKHNIFEKEESHNDYLEHSMALNNVLQDAIKHKAGSLREIINESMENGELAHTMVVPTEGMDVIGPGAWRENIPEGRPTVYGFNDPEALFPEPTNLNNPPEFISRDQAWVSVLIGGVHRSPFSRIKSVFADITEDEARAKGYTKTHKKTEEIFGLLKRVTTPTTIYKKQRMDHDDVKDITDFDVVPWIKSEMQVMFREEMARAILIGDGRSALSDDKIKEDCIRPIAKDDPLFTIKCPVNVKHDATEAEKADAAIDAIIRSQKDYKGSGNPILFTTNEWVTEMLLLKDGIGHRLYKTEAELATTLRVSRIVMVELLEGQTIGIEETSGGSTTVVQKPLVGVIVNPKDYNVGNDKNRGTEMFEDFDIDFNQHVWLMEDRFSGALTKPFSAISIYVNEAAAG